MRILIAGFQHETNTFADSRADWAAFGTGATFLGACRGEVLRAKLQGVNLPAAGFLAAAEAAGHGCHLGFWAGATPSGFITVDAYERIATEILADVQAHARGIDAIYLDLHGAAVAEHVADCEGELLERVRAVVGERMPIIVSLDLHANVSFRMLSLADAAISYRRYPHTDMADTGALAFELLVRRAKRGSKEAMHVRRLHQLIPIGVQTTWQDPAKGVYEQLAALERTHGTLMSFCPGFPAADVAECEPTVWGYGDGAKTSVEALYEHVARPGLWQEDVLPADEAVNWALSLAQSSPKAVVIADTQDNPGAGGPSCTTGVLHALLAAGAGKQFPRKVALGMICDPDAARAAHAAGVGKAVRLSLGKAVRCFDGKPSDPPVVGNFTVCALSDGQVSLVGPMMTKAEAKLGLCAALEIDGIRVVVSTERKQMLDRGLFQFVGIEPAACKLLVVKSSNHFRADFSPLVQNPQRDIVFAKARGAFAADPLDLPWQNIPAALRVRP